MGDMGDLFKDLKDFKQMRAQKRVAEFESKRADIETLISSIVDDRLGQVFFNVDRSGTFNIRLKSNTGPVRKRESLTTIQFYPTKGTWQIKGKMFHGGVDAFTAWIEKALRKLM
jgi:hypothetical protein